MSLTTCASDRRISLGGLPLLGALLLLWVPGCVATPTSGPAASTGVVATYNLTASPPVVPTPTDLIRAGGKLNVPVDPAEATTPALKAFNDYLRGLDGYPPDTAFSMPFSAAIDPASLNEGIYVWDATDGTLVSQSAAPPALATDQTGAVTPNQVTVNNVNRWKVGHRYVIAALSWQVGGAVHGVYGTGKVPVIADEAFPFLRGSQQIVGLCANAADPACVCPSLSSPACHVVVDGFAPTPTVTAAQQLASAQALEGARLSLSLATPLAALVQTLSQTLGQTLTVQDVVSATAFTISSHPFAAFDPTRGNVPFPSDTLLSTTTGLVNLPIATGDPLASIKQNLNKLDGFSTTGSAAFPIDTAYPKGSSEPLALDATTVVPISSTTAPAQASVILFQAELNPAVPSYTAAPSLLPVGSTTKPTGYQAQVLASPVTSLLDATEYAAIVTTAIKDKNGATLTPAPLTVLLSQAGPLIDANKKSVIPSISNAAANQLEPLRQQLQQLFLLLGTQGISANKVANFTVFTTQSVTAPLQAFADLPALESVPITISIDAGNPVTSGLPALLSNVGAVINGKMTTLQVVGNLSSFSDNTASKAVTTAKLVTIPFFMTMPLKGANNGNAPVVIGQHGLTRWRGDLIAIANSLAGAGLAMIAIDVNYHGSRAVCRSDADCQSGKAGACVGGSVGSATMPPTGGVCTGGVIPATPASTPLPGSSDYLPSTNFPNRDFTNFANPFAIRDNFRQHAIDQFQLVRVIQGSGANSLASAIKAAAPTLPALDTTHIGYVGQSLGAILGTNFMALNPAVQTGVLNVGGGRIVDIFIDPAGGFASETTALLAGFGVQPGTADALSLLDTLRWILDPGDPINLARHVRLLPVNDPLNNMLANPAKHVILEEAGADMVIPNEWTRRLGLELGLPLDASGHLLGISLEGSAGANNVSTFFVGADHGAIFDDISPTITADEQTQAVTYLLSGLFGPPTVVAP